MRDLEYQAKESYTVRDLEYQTKEIQLILGALGSH